jgi:1,4-alpha-glucan branching enzyme
MGVAMHFRSDCRFVEEYRIDGLRFDSAHNMPDWLVDPRPETGF